MAAEAFIQCRVPQATKAALRSAAERQQLTESALLKRMLQFMLHTADEGASVAEPDAGRGRGRGGSSGGGGGGGGGRGGGLGHADGAAADHDGDRPARRTRLYVRLTRGDRQLLQARSAVRCLAPATYASILLRAHLRALTPLPEAELRAIRQSTRELAAIGRNLNQIAHAAHQGRVGVGATREDLMNLLKACKGLHEHIRTYVSTNLASWSSGDATQ